MLHPAGSPDTLKQRRRQVEGVLHAQLAELLEQRVQLQAAMRRGERRQAPDRFRQLALGPDPSSTAGLVPRDCDMDETLEEVALLGRSLAPGSFEFFVRGEVLAGADEPDAGLEVSTRRRRREAVRGLPVRPF